MPGNITIILAGASLLLACQNPAIVKQQEVAISAADSAVANVKATDTLLNWVQINFAEDNMIERMAYADTGNFMHQNIYGCPKCFLRPEAAKALTVAGRLADKVHLRLVIFDCYRPKVYQQKMFDIVKNPDYVARPGKGSMHNKGLAVDLGLANAAGVLLDFGSAFDDFSERSNYAHNGLSNEARGNRVKLREIMLAAGFEFYDKEWWHFNYTKMNYPLDDFIWNCD